MRARGKERREAIWFRDAEVAEAIDAVLFVGLADWYPPNYDCGACGYATCAEFLHATKTCATTPTSSSSPAPTATCATSTSASPSAQPPRPPRSTPSTAAARPASPSPPASSASSSADIAVALSLSLTHKAVGFDRRMPDVDFDALDLPATGTLPIGVEGAARYGGARNRQHQRRPFEPRHDEG